MWQELTLTSNQTRSLCLRVISLRLQSMLSTEGSCLCFYPMKTVYFVFIFGALLAGCGPHKNVAKGAESGVFRYAIATTPTTLDPGIVQDVDTADLLSNVYEGLVAYGEDNKIKPNLAESYTVENGGRTYIFSLKKGAKFHNGRLVTAQDFKWTIERNCDPSLKSSTADSYLGDIVGALDRIKGKATSISGIEAVNDLTLKITIDKPRPYFLGKLTYPVAFVMAKEGVTSKEITSVSQSIGTGPFKMTSYVPDQEVRQESFKDYWGGAPKIDRIIRPIIKDAATRLNKYRAGELDFLGLERQDLAAIKADPVLSAQVKHVPRSAIYYVSMNQSIYAPFKDVRVRMAFAMSIDRKKIANGLLDQPEAKGFVPPGIIGARQALAGIPFDPLGAKKLLEDAGFPDGKGLPQLTISYREGRPDSQILAVGIVTDLRTNLGIDVKTKAMEWRSFLEARNRKELQFANQSWYADYLDPQNFLSLMMATGSGENRDGYSNPEFDKLCAQADSSLDEAKRIKLYQKAEDIAISDAARIPVYFAEDVNLIQPWVKGVRTNLFGLMPNRAVETTQN